ncbi:MAG: glycosyltransferase family 39 protein, partial [Alphaproteobacteria bacterium]
YLDFHTGYTPATFYLNAALLRIFGTSVLPVRALLAAVNTLSVVLVFRLALRFAPVAESAAAALAYALCMPFFAGQFASFNIPYPAWYALAAWLAAELAAVRAVETGRRAWLAASGILCGIAFSFKPNTWILALGAAVLGHLLATAPVAGVAGLVLETVVLVVAAASVAAVLGFEVLSGKFAWLGLPLAGWLLAAVVLRARRRRSGGAEACRPLSAALADGLVLAAGFALPNAPWLGYFLPRLGLARFGRDVLLLGAGVERIYGLDYPRPSPWTLIGLAALLGAVLVPRAIRAGWLGRRGLVAGLVAALLGVAVAAARSAVAPEGLVISTSMQVENLSFFLLPAVLAGAVLRELRDEARLARRPPAGSATGSRWAVALAWALLLFIQLYPRIDFMHVVISMPSALVIAAAALVMVRRDWLS